MFETNEINCFMTPNEIYNKVNLRIKVKPYGYFPPSNDNFNIFPIGINKNKTLIIDIHNNNIFFQNLDNLDTLRLNDGIYFGYNIIRCFLYG